MSVLLLDWCTGGWTTKMFFSVYRSSPWDLFSYIRLFGHVFGHAGLDHYIGNITLILVIGPVLEEKYGSHLILLAVLVTAVVSGLVHCLVSPSTALLGASGIVFMFIMLASLAGIEAGTIPLTMILVAVIYLGGEIAIGLTSRDGVSHLTHVVGGVCGTAIGFWLAEHPWKRHG